MQDKTLANNSADATKLTFHQKAFNLTVLITGLGYLVDTFDFFVYNGMRVVSLHELGLSGVVLTQAGICILNCQIVGALIGSFVWGVLGDKLGRKRPLIASILLYSAFMILNGFVNNVWLYGIIRFIIGFGVAGEVGLGATLVAETVAASKRTYAMMFFTIMGVLGVAIAGLSIEFTSWRMSCFIGGALGLLLLTFRSVLDESPIFIAAGDDSHKRGSLKILLGDLKNLKRFLLCIPILGCNFFITGVLLTLAPEVAKAIGVQGIIKPNIVLAIYFVVAIAGDLLSAWLTDLFKSRKIVMYIFIAANLFLALALLFLVRTCNVFAFYTACAVFGICNLWAISATVVVEQFPTHLRATASTANFNSSRAMVVLMNIVLLCLSSLGIIKSLSLIAVAVFGLALFCTFQLPETYGAKLNDNS